MKTAIDNYEIGKQKEIHIDKLPFIDRRHDRFICPECKEYVHIVDKGTFKYFAHGARKNAIVDECTRRVDGVPTQSIYERLGLPIYLRKIDNNYQLKIGFRFLPSNIIDECVEENAYIEIIENSRQKQKYFINYDNFSDSHITYIDIDCLSNDRDIVIKYSNKDIENKLKPYWSNRIEMINRSFGGLFSAGEKGGKLIHSGDNIEAYKKYYWVSPSGYITRSYKGVNFKQVGKINFYNSTYYVFEGSFDVDISDKINFKNLYNYLYYNMKVFLLEKNAEISPVWPPCIKNEDGYLFKDSERAFCVIDTNTTDPTVYSYLGNSPTPSVSQPKNVNKSYLIDVFAHKIGLMVSVDRRLVSNGVYIKSDCIEQISNYSLIECEDLDEYTSLSDINIYANGKVDVYLIDQSLNIYKKEYTNELVVFENYKKIESVWIVSNEYLIRTLKITGKQMNVSMLDDVYLLDICKKNKLTKEIIINSMLFKDIDYIIKNYPLLKSEFMKYKLKNKIPVGVAMVVRGISYGKK